jgi:hypothetical protein
MTKYHVILTDECGDEFSVEIEASDRDDAWDTVQMDYPECGVVTVVESGGYRIEAMNRTFNQMWGEDDDDFRDDRLSQKDKQTNDRLDMGRNVAGEWLGFM